VLALLSAAVFETTKIDDPELKSKKTDICERLRTWRCNFSSKTAILEDEKSKAAAEKA